MPDLLDRDREDLALAVGRTMPLAREDGGDLIVIHASTREGERAIAHFLSSRELDDGVDPPLDLKLGHSPATRNDPDRGDVVFAAIEHDLVDEASQQGLTLSIGGGCVAPDLRETACEADDLALHILAHAHLSNRLGRGLLGKSFFGRSNLVQRSLPARTLKFGGDKTIIGCSPD